VVAKVDQAPLAGRATGVEVAGHREWQAPFWVILCKQSHQYGCTICRSFDTAMWRNVSAFL